MRCEIKKKKSVSFRYTQGIKKYLSQEKKKKILQEKYCPDFQSIAYTSNPTE